MKIIIVSLIYICVILILNDSKLKNSWIVFISFTVGIYCDVIAEFIINNLK